MDPSLSPQQQSRAERPSWNSLWCMRVGRAGSLSPHLQGQQLLLLPHTRDRGQEKPGTETAGMLQGKFHWAEPGKPSLAMEIE